MALVRKYLKERQRPILLFALFCVIFGAVFALYHLPVQAVIYPSALCALFGIAIMVLDFGKVKHRHTELTHMCSLPAAMLQELPETDSIESQDYQALIRALQTEAASIETRSAAQYRNRMDYYTIWVHQIKTPIASMRLTLQEMDSPEARKLQADLFRIEQYAQMVLAYLRLDSETSDYVFKEYSVDEIIRGAVKKFSHEFIGRKIALQYAPIELAIVTDEKWLSFVLEQLISNALKYTRSGSVKIYLREPKMLCIEDTGIGIAPEDLPRVFEKGYTGCNGRADKKASGIGLYLCKRVCDNLGIQIAVTSQVGQGTTVSLDLRQHTQRKE